MIIEGTTRSPRHRAGLSSPGTRRAGPSTTRPWSRPRRGSASPWAPRVSCGSVGGRDGEGDLDHDRTRATGASNAVHARDGLRARSRCSSPLWTAAPTCMSSSRAPDVPRRSCVRRHVARDRGARPAGAVQTAPGAAGARGADGALSILAIRSILLPARPSLGRAIIAVISSGATALGFITVPLRTRGSRPSGRLVAHGRVHGRLIDPRIETPAGPAAGVDRAGRGVGAGVRPDVDQTTLTLSPPVRRRWRPRSLAITARGGGGPGEDALERPGRPSQAATASASRTSRSARSARTMSHASAWLVPKRVDKATDHVVVIGVKHRVCEAGPLGEDTLVALESAMFSASVIWWGQSLSANPGSVSIVVDGGRPGGVVAIIVLRTGG